MGGGASTVSIPLDGKVPHLFGWSRPSVSHLGRYPLIFKQIPVPIIPLARLAQA
jgi:hypothetical protein